MASDRITPAMARRIELWPIERLAPYQRNPRTHTEEQVTQIAASIAEFGFCNPILVDSRDGIVAGHGRLLAAKKLGLSEVPVIVLDHLNETQRRAYLLADNRLSELAGWDEELLKQDLAELEDSGVGLDVIGFSDEQIADLLGTTDPPEEQPESGEDEEGYQANIIVRLSIPASVWLGNRQAIIEKLEAMGKKYLWDYRVDE